MFTGIVDAVGCVEAYSRTGGAGRLTVRCPCGWLSAKGVVVGDSVAVDGACLTVAAVLDGDIFCVDVSAETAAVCAAWSSQKLVNLESALLVGDKLGGHFVGGHIDGVAVLIKKETADGGNVFLRWRADSRLMPFIAKKGAVCLGGVSLTVNETAGDIFAVNIIPHTLNRTTLRLREIGDKVNLETDLIARHIKRLIAD